jgi:hypothetical protein
MQIVMSGGSKHPPHRLPPDGGRTSGARHKQHREASGQLYQTKVGDPLISGYDTIYDGHHRTLGGARRRNVMGEITGAVHLALKP